MNRRTRLLAAGTALLGALATGLAAPSPAAAHHFGRFGFGFGYPIFYGPALYVPPPTPVYPVYPVYVAPPVVYGYNYGYRYRYRVRVVHHVAVRHYHRAVVHRYWHHEQWCGCR